MNDQQYANDQSHASATRGLDEFWSLLPEEAGRDRDGSLTIGGVSVDELAATYGTPLHIMDEAGLRRQIRRFVHGLRDRWPNSEVLFASKSLPVQAMYAIAQSEGLSVDVAGGGELQLALAAGVQPERIHFHGNAKTDAEVEMALAAGVGAFVVDNADEVDRLERLLTKPQELLLRVIPGVDAVTHPSQATGGNDSKFGVSLTEAPALIARMRANPLMRVAGVHMHIGSQILESAPFAEAVRNISVVGEFDTYDVGGGLGVRYTYAENPPTVETYLDALVDSAQAFLPAGAKLLIEPGRSVVARAGVTLYEVVSVKRGAPTFVAVNGGLADQLDIALTGQRYEAMNASRLDEAWTETAHVVGRQCESGDLLVRDAPLAPARVGDLLVMPVTGAYSYTTSNNYNGALKPAMVFVANGQARLAVRREEYEDLLRTHAPALGEDWTALPAAQG